MDAKTLGVGAAIGLRKEDVDLKNDIKANIPTHIAEKICFKVWVVKALLWRKV